MEEDDKESVTSENSWVVEKEKKKDAGVVAQNDEAEAEEKEEEEEDEEWVLTNMTASTNLNVVNINHTPAKIVSEDYYPTNNETVNKDNDDNTTSTSSATTKTSIINSNDDEYPTLQQAQTKKKQKQNNSNGNYLKNNYYESIGQKEEMIAQVNEVYPHLTHAEIESIISGCREHTIAFVLDYISSAHALAEEEKLRYKKANNNTTSPWTIMM